METISEGTVPNFYEAFAELHLSQTLALVKCLSGDRCDRRIDPNAYHILRNIVSTRLRVDEYHGIAALGRHQTDSITSLR
jgi:hypothetical protein